MRRTARFVCICLSLLLLLSTAAFADNTVYTEGTLYYTVADECITITGYFGKAAEVTVPSMIAGLPVSVIAMGAFVGTHATTVYLPDTIMEVQEGAIGAGVRVVFASNTAAPVEISDTPENTSPVSSSEASEPADPETVSPAAEAQTPEASAPADSDTETSEPILAEPVTDEEDSNTEPFEDTMDLAAEPAAEQTEQADESESEALNMPLSEPTLISEPETAPEPEAPTDPTAPAEPKKPNTTLWIVLCAVLLIVDAALLLFLRKKKPGKAE